jgi:hypothetical protein
MSEVLYEIIDENGILYHPLGSDGGATERLPKGSKITSADIEKGSFTFLGLQNLESKGRVKKVSEEKKAASKSNKKAPKQENKKESNDG